MNRVQLIGNLTRDPETRTTGTGLTVCRFTLAVNRRMKKQDGTQETDYINVTAWRTLGENCAKYLSKGKKAGVSGSIQTRTYEAQDGSKRHAFEVVADEVEFLSPVGGSAQRGNSGSVGANVSDAGDQAATAQAATTVQVETDELPF